MPKICHDYNSYHIHHYLSNIIDRKKLSQKNENKDIFVLTYYTKWKVSLVIWYMGKKKNASKFGNMDKFQKQKMHLP